MQLIKMCTSECHISARQRARIIKSSARKSLMGEPRIITLFQNWTFDCLKGQIETFSKIFAPKNATELILTDWNVFLFF